MKRSGVLAAVIDSTPALADSHYKTNLPITLTPALPSFRYKNRLSTWLQEESGAGRVPRESHWFGDVEKVITINQFSQESKTEKSISLARAVFQLSSMCNSPIFFFLFSRPKDQRRSRESRLRNTLTWRLLLFSQQKHFFSPHTCTHMTSKPREIELRSASSILFTRDTPSVWIHKTGKKRGKWRVRKWQSGTAAHKATKFWKDFRACCANKVSLARV